MSALLSITGAVVVGVGLGLLYFDGLWRTVRALPEVSHPGVLLLGSFLVRLAVVMVGFYLLLGAGGAYLAGGLVGFMAARFVLVRHRRPDSALPPHPRSES